MDVNRLAQFVSRPDVHREVLRGYSGPYALGVTRLNNDDRAGALRLRVQDGNAEEFPDEIEVDGERVPVLVDVNWTAPRRQTTATSLQ
jgi:hypothetical protein